MRVRSGGYCNTSETGNSEYWAIDPSGSFFVLSTGLSDHASTASQKVCEEIVKQLIPHRSQIAGMAADTRPDSRQMLMTTLCNAIAKGERGLFDMGEQSPNYKGMAATVDMLYLANGSVYIGHVGYNRIYLLRGDMGRQLTIDHTVYEYLKSQGKREEDLRNTAYKDDGRYDQLDTESFHCTPSFLLSARFPRASYIAPL